MEKDYSGPLLNVGTGEDVTVRKLAETIMQVVGFEGRIVFDDSKPDGTMRKVLNISQLSTQNWKAVTSLQQGITLTYCNFLKIKQTI